MNVMITEIPTRHVPALSLLRREMCFSPKETSSLHRKLLQHSGVVMYRIKLFVQYTNQQMYSIMKY